MKHNHNHTQNIFGTNSRNNQVMLSYESNPLISIVTVVFNGVDILEQTILSVINQSYKNVEFIVVDGNSTDGTIELLKKYDSYISKWVSEQDSGIYDAMNKGIELASGKWINFMNGGDTFYDEEVLSNVVLTLNPQCQVCFGKSLTYFNEYEVLRYSSFNAEDPEFYLQKLPNHQAVFIRDDKYKGLKYSLDMKYCSDTEYLRKVFQNSNYCEFNGIVSRFELGGISNFYGSWKVCITMIREYKSLGYGTFYSIFAHSLKYSLQKLLGKQRYLNFYIQHLVKK